MNTTNMSLVTPKTAGIESSANTRSVTSMATRATNKGVAMIFRFLGFFGSPRTKKRPPA